MRMILLLGTLCLSALASAEPPRQALIDAAIERGAAWLLEQVRERQLPKSDEHGKTLTNLPGLPDPVEAIRVAQVAFETYALVVCGVGVDDPAIAKNFEFLKKRAIGSKFVYGISSYVFALDAAIAQLEQDALLLDPRKTPARVYRDRSLGSPFKSELKKAVKALVTLQGTGGAWHYTKPPAAIPGGAFVGPNGPVNYDGSNTQFAVLALGIGAKRRVEIDSKVWIRILEFLLKEQASDGEIVLARITMDPKHDDERVRISLVPEKRKRKPSSKRDDSKREKGSKREKESGRDSGKTVLRDPDPENPELGTESTEVLARGWPYCAGFTRICTWNVACAGLSSLLIARDATRGSLSDDRGKTLNRAVRDGYGWLLENWKNQLRDGDSQLGYYGMYSLEKVGDLGGVLKFGRFDWYAQIARQLLEAQEADGRWQRTNFPGESDRVTSSFALLVLCRASSLLTRDPSSRVILTGEGAPKGADDRAWVFVPELRRLVNWRHVLRMLRFRPSRKLALWVRSVIDAHDPRTRGDLVPGLAEAAHACRTKSTRKVLDRYLTEITGMESETIEDYRRWHETWKRVLEIGDTQQRDRSSELLGAYESSNSSVVLKTTLLWALARCRVRDALPRILDDLEAKSAEVRQAADDAFRSFFVEAPPQFEAGGTEKRRARQLEAIRRWYRQREGRSL